jgi:tetracycline repressor-like protein
MESAAQDASDKAMTLTEGQLIFEDAQLNNALYRILLSTQTGSQGSSRIRRRVQEMIASTFRHSCQPLPQNQPIVPAEVAANHIAASLLALIDWWLEYDMPYSAEEMARTYEQLIIRPTVVLQTA